MKRCHPPNFIRYRYIFVLHIQEYSLHPVYISERTDYIRVCTYESEKHLFSKEYPSLSNNLGSYAIKKLEANEIRTFGKSTFIVRTISYFCSEIKRRKRIENT